MDKKYFIHDDPNMEPIEKEYQIKGYYYGKQLVPISKVFESELKYKTERCLKILGFVPKKQLPRNFMMGTVDMVLPIKDSEKVQQGFFFYLLYFYSFIKILILFILFFLRI